MANQLGILVIDDDPDFLDYVSIILSSCDYRVLTATNVSDGLALARAEHPALVIADVMMSYAMDGWAITRQIREDPALRAIPILMVSAVVSNEDDALFPDMRNGEVSSFMSKPIDPAALLQSVEVLTRPV